MGALLLDSASLYYRAFYALPESITAPDGTPVNAVRGFLETIAMLVRERGSQTVVACWDDDWRPQWRVDLIPSYKTHRLAQAVPVGGEAVEDEPDALGPQIDIIAGLLEAVGIPRIGAPECEADDVIATLAHRLREPVDIASGDRDLVQLVNERVTLLYTGGSSASRGGRPFAPWDPAGVQERFGVAPAEYADLAVLRGDPSDGLPGVRGIGEKTAAALVTSFGNLSGILAAARQDELRRPMTPALRDRLLEAEPTLRRAEQAVRLGPRSGVPPLRSSTWNPERGLAAAEQVGVGRAMGRLIDALVANR